MNIPSKNKFQSYVFEEEIEHSNNNKNNQNNLMVMNKKKNNSKKHQESLIDSLEGLVNMKDSKVTNSNSLNNLDDSSLDKLVIKVGGDEFQLEGEHNGLLKSYLKDLNNLFDPKVICLIK